MIFFIELKALDGKTSLAQNYLIDSLSYHGFDCFICKTELEFLEVCEKVFKLQN